MATVYNAAEVLEMAIRIEQNAVEFYTRAAELKKQERIAEFLRKLAAVENDHEEEFRSLRDQLAEEERLQVPYDPSGEAEAYLRALADGHRGEGSPRAAAEIKSGTPLAEILRKAVVLERETIGFYSRLVQWVPERLGKEKVQKILQEEQAHLQGLEDELQGLPASS